MSESRLDPKRRRFLAVSAMSLASAALAGRGLAVRARHRAEESLVAGSCWSSPLVHPEDPPVCEEQPFPEFLDYHVATEAEAYAEFINSLGLRYITAAEVLRPHWSDINGVRNELPPRELWPKLPPTLRMADAMRERLGVPLLKISSAYRSPKYNRMVAGSASRSYHTSNQALDLVFACSAHKATAVARQLRSEGRFRGGIGQYSTFVHLDTRGYNANWRKG
jgi:hypothetical protein